MEMLAQFMPIIATIVGALLAVISGMNLAKQDQIIKSLASFEGRLLEYSLTQVRHDEKLMNLMDVIQKAHERIDHLKEAR